MVAFCSDPTDGCILSWRRKRIALPPPDTSQPVHPTQCFEQTPICNGPDHISKYVPASALLVSTNINNALDAELGESSGPYAKHVDLSVSFHLAGDPAYGIFACEAALGGLTALIICLALELTSLIFPVGHLSTLCGKI